MSHPAVYQTYRSLVKGIAECLMLLSEILCTGEKRGPVETLVWTFQSGGDRPSIWWSKDNGSGRSTIYVYVSKELLCPTRVTREKDIK